MRQGSKILLTVLILIILSSLVFVFYTIQKGKAPTTTTSSPAPSTLPKVEEVGGEAASEISLEITSPKDGSTVTAEGITVTGKTVSNAEVFVNDVSAKADSQGNFSVKITLDEGENTISVLANDDSGNYAEKEITVTLNTE